MDRPEDEFCWDNVEKIAGECQHCKKDFPGESSCIRSHLSGEEENDTQLCEAVPKEIKEGSFNGSAMKKARYSPLEDGVDVANQIMTIANNKQPSSSSKGSEEIVADTLVDFLINRNVSVNIIKDSYFRDFLRMVAQHGSVPSWLLHDDSVVIRRSLLNYEDVVNQHIREVKESWKTTGFTYMFYNLNELKEKVSSSHDEENLVIGWYSPKGFFFTEGRRFAKLYNDSREDTDSMSLAMCDAVQYIHHPRAMRLCHYQSWDLTDYYYRGNGVRSVWCVENRIQMFCDDICRQSDWVRNVMEKSKKIYEYMRMFSTFPSRNWIQEQFEYRFKHLSYESSYSHLLSVIELKDELEQWQSITILGEEGPWSQEIQSIISDGDFWCDGKELESALSPLLYIYHLVDSLDPPSGKLFSRINEAKRNLKTYYDVDVSTYQAIWDCFEDYFGALETEKEEPSAYLSPAYIRSDEANLELSDQGKLALKRFVETEELEALDAELEAYSIKSINPFAELTEHEYEYGNPFKLWDVHGSDQFPLLKRCAMKLLSQPASCMCNQVKKQMSEIQGSDNLILRLNYKMMAEFKNKKLY